MSRMKTYLQLLEVVVKEDKLRVGSRNVLHHQVMAELRVKAHRDSESQRAAGGREKDTTEECPGPRRL